MQNIAQGALAKINKMKVNFQQNDQMNEIINNTQTNVQTQGFNLLSKLSKVKLNQYEKPIQNMDYFSQNEQNINFIFEESENKQFEKSQRQYQNYLQEQSQKHQQSQQYEYNHNYQNNQQQEVNSKSRGALLTSKQEKNIPVQQLSSYQQTIKFSEINLLNVIDIKELFSQEDNFYKKIPQCVLVLRNFNIRNDIVDALFEDETDFIIGSIDKSIVKKKKCEFQLENNPESIYLVKNSAYLLKNCTVFKPQEEQFIINIMASNIEHIVYF